MKKNPTTSVAAVQKKIGRPVTEVTINAVSMKLRSTLEIGDYSTLVRAVEHYAERMGELVHIHARKDFASELKRTEDLLTKLRKTHED